MIHISCGKARVWRVWKRGFFDAIIFSLLCILMDFMNFAHDLYGFHLRVVGCWVIFDHPYYVIKRIELTYIFLRNFSIYLYKTAETYHSMYLLSQDCFQLPGQLLTTIKSLPHLWFYFCRFRWSMYGCMMGTDIPGRKIYNRSIHILLESHLWWCVHNVYEDNILVSSEVFCGCF
jgi:hypothetical protein